MLIANTGTCIVLIIIVFSCWGGGGGGVMSPRSMDAGPETCQGMKIGLRIIPGTDILSICTEAKLTQTANKYNVLSTPQYCRTVLTTVMTQSLGVLEEKSWCLIHGIV